MRKLLHLMLISTLLFCNVNLIANNNEDETYQVLIGTGTETDNSTPFVIRNSYSWSETIYPGKEIGGACTIKAISYHSTAPATGNTPDAVLLKELDIYMAVTPKQAFTSPMDWTLSENLILVYSGKDVTVGDTPWEKITLDVPFYYNGNDNLVVVVAKKTEQYKSNNKWYYTKDNTSLTYTLYYGNDQNENIADNPPTTSNVGTRMTYRANIVLDVVYGEMSSPISVSPDPIDLGYRPSASWTRPAKITFSTDTTTAYILDIESSSPSFIVSNFQTPAEVSKDNPFSVSVKLSNSNVVGEFKGKLSVKNNFTTDDFEIKATTYSPIVSDVWEKAVEVSSYPYANTPDFDNIYDNYFLPGDTPDGPDAVYKLTIEEPTTLAVGVDGENAKMALYAENFNGKGGPDVDNYYGATIDPNQPSEPEFPEIEIPELKGNSFSYDFEDGSLEDWRTIDIDEDKFNWQLLTSGVGDNVKCIASYSYNPAGGGVKLYPDNYIVTRGLYAIDKKSVLEFDVRALDSENLNDTYEVVVSTDGIHFSHLGKEKLYSDQWGHREISLAEYAGQNVVIGFRHFETGTHSYAVLIDNVTLTPGRGARYSKTEKYTVPAGVYYLAVSATERFSVNINATTENGYNPVTEVRAEEVDENNINVNWSWDFISENVELNNNKSLNKTREENQKKTVLGYNLYRKNTLDEAEPKLIAENLTDTSYVDNTWKDVSMGLYQWGVSVIYDNNNGGKYETPIAYSNAVGKNMFTKFNVAVTTENELSAAGTKVSFYNVYEPAFKYDVTLDETGTFTWDSFRKGTYRYSMSLEGYKQGPQNKLIEIWDETTLEYTFEEVFVLGDIFVSSTGWAMWNDEAASYQVKLDGEKVAEVSKPYYQFDVKNLVEGKEYTTTVVGSKELEYTWIYNPCDDLVQASDFEVEAEGKEISVYWTLPVQGYTPISSEAKFDFEDGTLNGWLSIDADCDGYKWANSKEYSQTECGYQSWHGAMSHSCIQTSALTPDNYLVTAKKYLITENSKLRFNVSAENRVHSAEHYGVALSSETNFNVADFKTIFEETLPADDNSETSHGTWYEKTIDLSEYAGQEVYIAFRHYDCTNQFWINIDNVELTTVNTRKPEGDWMYYDNGKNYDALGLQGGASFYWGIMFPAADMQKFEGRSLTKVSLYDIAEHEGRFMIYLGGNKAPEMMIHSQEYKTKGVKDFVDFELTTPVDITGEHNVWVVFNNYSNQYVAANCVGPTDPNGRWFSSDGTQWVDMLTYSGYNLTWQIRAYVENVPIPNPTDLEVLGAMLFRDGELLTETPLTEENFVETLPEYGDYEYSLRVVYGGEEETYYAMSCPQNITLNHVLKCKAPKNLYAESAVESDGRIGTKLEWPYTLHGTEWLHYDNGIVETALGFGGASVYWGIMFPGEDLEFYNGTLLTKVSVYDYQKHDGNIQIYYGGDEAPEMMIHSQPYECSGSKDFVEFELTAPIPVDATINLWVVFNSNNGSYPAAICENTGNKNGRWMSPDGKEWADIGTVPSLDGTFMIRAFVTSSLRGEITLGQERDEEAKLSHYNVYRGTSMDNLEVVAKPTAGYYFDEVEKGTYYYKVTATYIEGDVECESDPANSYLNPEDKFVKVDVTAIDENGVSAVMIYPNPTNSNLNITAEGLKRVTVFNALGQMMYDNDANSDNTVVDMSRYDVGIYMVRITTENGMTVQKVSVIK